MQYSGKELMEEIRKIMRLKNVQIKELAVLMNKSQQSVSQIFKLGNPKYSTLIEICNALGLKLNIYFEDESDTD